MGELAPADDLLIARIAEGDREAFAELYRRHRADICRFAAHMCGSTAAAEDVVHEAFVAVIDSASRYRPGRTTARLWLLGIARNHARRARAMRPMLSLHDAAQADSSRLTVEVDPVADLERGRHLEALHRALAALPVRYREAIVLCDLHELSYIDAATALGCTIGTVRSRLHRGRVLLARRLCGRPTGAGNEQHAEERLTARTIEGLRVEGLRRTTTIPAGAVGNERPIVVTSDEWTSPELKVLVLSESSDPRSGTSTYKLVNVRRGDPPASLFQVPADYTTVQAPRPFVASPPGRGEGRGEGRGGRSGPPPR